MNLLAGARGVIRSGSKELLVDYSRRRYWRSCFWPLFNLPSHGCFSLSFCTLWLLFLTILIHPLFPRVSLSIPPSSLCLLSSCPFARPQPQPTGHYCEQGFASSTQGGVRGRLEVGSCCAGSIWRHTHSAKHGQVLTCARTLPIYTQ